MSELTLTIDGFPLGTADPDCQIQLLINEELETAQRAQAASETAFPAESGENNLAEMARIRNRSKTELLYPRLAAAANRGPWLLPILRRFNWPGSSSHESGHRNRRSV